VAAVELQGEGHLGLQVAELIPPPVAARPQRAVAAVVDEAVRRSSK
jgi:hypothetical protein